MAKNKKITLEYIKHLAKLANLPISDDRLLALVDQIETTFEYVDTLQATDTNNVAETNQVTGLTNIMRADEIQESRMLTQEQALAGAKKTYQGYFLVPAILE